MLGVGGHVVTVEAHVGRGLPTLIVTGLPGAGVQDASAKIRQFWRDMTASLRSLAGEQVPAGKLG